MLLSNMRQLFIALFHLKNLDIWRIILSDALPSSAEKRNFILTMRLLVKSET